MAEVIFPVGKISCTIVVKDLCSLPAFSINPFKSKNANKYDIYFTEYDEHMLPANATATFSTTTTNLEGSMNTYPKGPRLDTKFAYSGDMQEINDAVGFGWPGKRKCDPKLR